MENVFLEKVCFVCKNYKTENCSKIIQKEIKNGITITSCKTYLKDSSKIEPYKKPLIVTADRNYVNNVER